MACEEKRSLWDLDKPAPEPEPYKRRPKTEDELKQLAKDIAAGQVFTNRHIHDENMLASVFMIIYFVDWDEDWAKDFNDNAGLVYEYLEKASPRSINGYPMFFSMQWLDKPETEKVLSYVEAVKTALAQI